MTSKKHKRATVERNFFNIIFKFLKQQKRFLLPQQFPLKPPTENDTVSFRESTSF